MERLRGEEGGKGVCTITKTEKPIYSKNSIREVRKRKLHREESGNSTSRKYEQKKEE